MTDAEPADEVHILIVELGRRPRPDLVELILEILHADVETNKKRCHSAAPVRLPRPITALGRDQDQFVAARRPVMSSGTEPVAAAAWQFMN